MFSNMPITLSRFSPGVNVNDAQTQVSQGYVDNTSLSAGSLLGLPLAGTQNPLTPPVGGNNYTIDGANNNGSNRRIAASPNSDMIQEMRVESSNFDASVGHGLGLQISMMTRAGTNRQRGTVNYQYWSNKLNALTAQQKTTFDDRAKSEFEKGRSHNLSLTSGGPVRIPGVVDGRGKLFYFANYSLANDAIPARSRGRSRSRPTTKHLQGDFSDLLRLPNPAQYQIYDPLTTRPDPANPARMIRDPFPNNIIPRDRIFNPDGTYKNPLMALYSKMVPKPNQNFIENGQQPLNNFYRGGEPDSPKSQQYGFRLDFNASSKDRFFFRTSGITFLEYVSDWTYPRRIRRCGSIRPTVRATSGRTPAPGRARMGTTVLDTSFATNRFNQIDEFRGLKQYKPTDVGLPAYLDEFCSTRGGCTLPSITIGPAISRSAAGCRTATPPRTCRASRRSPRCKGRHTLHGGVDVRRAQRDRTGGGNRSGQLTFDRTYTRQFSDEATLTPSNLGLSLAAFELGLPTSASINDTVPSSFSNYWMGTFAPGHVASGPLHAQRRPSLRIRDRRPGEERPDDRRLRSRRPGSRSPTPRRRPTSRAACRTSRECPRRSASSAGRSTPTTPASPALAYAGRAMWMPRVSAST